MSSSTSSRARAGGSRARDETVELEQKLKASETRAQLKGVHSALDESERRRDEEREAWTSRPAALSAVLTEQQLDSQRKADETERLRAELSSAQRHLARALSEARTRKRLSHDRLQLEHELRAELGAFFGLGGANEAFGYGHGLRSSPVADLRPQTPTTPRSGLRARDAKPGTAGEPQNPGGNAPSIARGESPVG